jgi:drug/metabolite transporter (DMT)-like permease
MDLKLNPTYSAIYGELVLALYPILIKSIPTTLLTQTLARFGTFFALGLTLGPFKDFLAAWATPETAFRSLTHGILNLVHVASSYLSYKDLPAGPAVSLFYTYPIMILLGRVLFFNEKIAPIAYLFIAIALIGVYLVASSQEFSEKKFSENNILPALGQVGQEKKSDDNGFTKNTLRGISGALLSAFTETLIYFLVRENPHKTPFFAINNLYPSGLAALLGYSFMNPEQVDTKPKTWVPLLAFNGILGFTGYMLRFFSIPRLETIIFSMLSFIGVMAAYIWGLLFANEKPTMQGLLGGGLIATAISLMRYFKL